MDVGHELDMSHSSRSNILNTDNTLSPVFHRDILTIYFVSTSEKDGFMPKADRCAHQVYEKTS